MNEKIQLIEYLLQSADPDTFDLEILLSMTIQELELLRQHLDCIE